MPQLRERLDKLIALGRYQLIVDMSEVNFMDSTGLGVLVMAHKQVRSHDGTLSLVCDRENILKVFRLTALTKVFPIYASLERVLETPVGTTDDTEPQP